MLVDGNHRFRDLDKPMLAQGYDYRPLTIGDNATILSKATIVANVGNARCRRRELGRHARRPRLLRSRPAFRPCVIDYFGPEPARSASSAATSG